MKRPLVYIAAKHDRGGKIAANASAKDAGNLIPSLVLCVGAKVVYLANMWTSRGVVHGLVGEVVEIVYAPGTKPLRDPGPGTESGLPMVVFMKAQKYFGPTFANLDLSESDLAELRGMFSNAKLRDNKSTNCLCLLVPQAQMVRCRLFCQCSQWYGLGLLSAMAGMCNVVGKRFLCGLVGHIPFTSPRA